MGWCLQWCAREICTVKKLNHFQSHARESMWGTSPFLLTLRLRCRFPLHHIHKGSAWIPSPPFHTPFISFPAFFLYFFFIFVLTTCSKNTIANYLPFTFFFSPPIYLAYAGITAYAIDIHTSACCLVAQTHNWTSNYSGHLLPHLKRTNRFVNRRLKFSHKARYCVCLGMIYHE
jgi:hypothetical protein